MRREHQTILNDILLAIETSMVDGVTSITRSRLASKANVAFDRLCVALAELADAGLVEDAPRPRLTTRGIEYVRAYHAWVRTTQQFGLTEAEPLLAVPGAEAGRSGRR